MNVKKCVRALLCLYLTLIIAMDAVKAQTLKVGDTLPPELWSMPLQVINHPTGKETLTLSEYKDKLIILDFWATWCAPCIKSLTKLDTLQREFGEQLAVVPITYEAGEKVLPMFQKRGWSLPSVINDSTLKKYFPHRSIPHQVWVRAGEVLAVTGAEYATRENIRLGIQGNPLGFKEKNEVDFDKTKPLFLNGNGGDGSNMLYQSVISGRLNAEMSGFHVRTDGIMAYNQTIEQLYRFALGDSISTLFADRYTVYSLDEKSKDKIRLPEVYQTQIRQGITDEISLWLNTNQYCYNQVLPAGFSEIAAKSKMLSDLNFYFGNSLNIHLAFKPIDVDAIVLVKCDSLHTVSGNNDRSFKKWTDGGKTLVLQNQPVSVLLHYIHLALKEFKLPLSDETGISEPLSLVLHSEDFRDFFTMKRALNKYGLDLREQPSVVKMAVYTLNGTPSNPKTK